MKSRTNKNIAFYQILSIKLILLILALIVSTNRVISQENVEFNKANFSAKPKEFKNAFKSLKTGYFLMDNNKYDIALEKLLEANSFNSNNAVLNYSIGICYLGSHNRYKALPYFLTSKNINNKISPNINYLIGQSYQLNYQFKKAIEYYSLHMDLVSSNDKIMINLTNKRIQECEYGILFMSEPYSVQINNLGNNVNSEYPDYLPMLCKNDSIIFFTSRRSTTTGKLKDPNDSKFYEDIFYTVNINGEWQPAINIGNTFNTPGHDAIVGSNYDGSKLIYFNNDKNGGDISISYNENGNWGKPIDLPETINTIYNESSASFSLSGDTLYFVSDRPDLSTGGKDILYSYIDENNEWVEPKNLGNKINTKYDEEGISFFPNGKTIFFSSKGHSSMGGYDIFRSDRDEDGNWKKPVNIGYPINSPDDDLYFTISRDGQKGYYCSSYEEGLGGLDIYMINFINVNPLTYTSSVDIEKISGELTQAHDSLFIKQDLAEMFRPNVYLQSKPNAKKTVLKKLTCNKILIKIRDISTDKSVSSRIDRRNISQEILIAKGIKCDVGVKVNDRSTSFGKAVLLSENIEEEITESTIEISRKDKKSAKNLLSENKTFIVRLISSDTINEKPYFNNVDSVYEYLLKDNSYSYVLPSSYDYLNALILKDKLIKIGYKHSDIIEKESFENEIDERKYFSESEKNYTILISSSDTTQYESLRSQLESFKEIRSKYLKYYYVDGDFKNNIEAEEKVLSYISKGFPNSIAIKKSELLDLME